MKAATVFTGFLLLGVTVLPASATMLGVARSICGSDLPDAVAATMANNTPNDPLGSANCPALCDKWVTMCKGMVGTSKACFTAAFTKVANMRYAECSFHTDPAMKEVCRGFVTSDWDYSKGQLATSVTDGLSFCGGLGHVTCRFSCD